MGEVSKVQTQRIERTRKGEVSKVQTQRIERTRNKNSLPEDRCHPCSGSLIGPMSPVTWGSSHSLFYHRLGLSCSCMSISYVLGQFIA